jgi:hypothetical protein
MNNQKSAATDQHGINSNTTNVVSTCGDSSVIDLKLEFQNRNFVRKFRGKSVFSGQAEEKGFN